MEWDTRKKFGKPYQKFSDETVPKALITGGKKVKLSVNMSMKIQYSVIKS